VPEATGSGAVWLLFEAASALGLPPTWLTAARTPQRGRAVQRAAAARGVAEVPGAVGGVTSVRRDPWGRLFVPLRGVREL